VNNIIHLSGISSSDVNTWVVVHQGPVMLEVPVNSQWVRIRIPRKNYGMCCMELVSAYRRGDE